MMPTSTGSSNGSATNGAGWTCSSTPIAFADKDDLVGPYYKVSRAGFLKALEIGAYSFTAVARGAVR